MINLKSIKLPNPNAVLYKDMKQKTKNSKLVSSVFFTNLILVLIAGIIMLVIMVSSLSNENIEYDIFTGMFTAFAFIEFAFISFVTPSITAGSITMEIEKQTFDVLLTTKLTPWQIILGKFWASILQILLLIVSGLPVFSLVFVYGGVSFIQAIVVLFILMFTAVYFASFGILASSLTKKTVTATVLVFMLVFGALFGTFSLVATIKSVMLLIKEAIEFSSNVTIPFNGDSSYFLLYINPLTTLYDSLSVVGLKFFDSDFPGVGSIISEMSDYSRNNLLLKYWGIISLVVQGVLTYFALKIAANNIDPLRKRKPKKVKTNGKKRTK